MKSKLSTNEKNKKTEKEDEKVGERDKPSKPIKKSFPDTHGYGRRKLERERRERDLRGYTLTQFLSLTRSFLFF